MFRILQHFNAKIRQVHITHDDSNQCYVWSSPTGATSQILLLPTNLMIHYVGIGDDHWSRVTICEWCPPIEHLICTNSKWPPVTFLTEVTLSFRVLQSHQYLWANVVRRANGHVWGLHKSRTNSGDQNYSTFLNNAQLRQYFQQWISGILQSYSHNPTRPYGGHDNACSQFIEESGLSEYCSRIHVQTATILVTSILFSPCSCPSNTWSWKSGHIWSLLLWFSYLMNRKITMSET